MSIVKTTRKLINSRRNKILTEIQINNKVMVNTLSEKMNVSPLTIRRDLQILEDQGLIERFYGGARFKSHHNTTSDIYHDAISKIAKVASRYVNDNDIIFLNSSKITLKMIEYIVSKNVTIITNNANVVSIKPNPNVSIFLTGGELNINKKSLTGDFSIQNLININATKCFLGCNGITRHGTTTLIPQEVSINKYMLDRCTGEIFILAETQKIGREYNFLSCSISKIDTLITNNVISDELIRIKKEGVKIIYTN